MYVGVEGDEDALSTDVGHLVADLSPLLLLVEEVDSDRFTLQFHSQSPDELRL